VRGDPLKLADDDPQILRPLRDLLLPTFFHGQAVGQLLSWRQVIQAVGQDDDLRIGAFFRQLFRRPVQVATSGWALVTISPSAVTATRSTPWVDGCWGPRLMNMPFSGGC